MGNETKFSVMQTIGGIPVALVTWMAIYFLVFFALYLLDSTRGLSEDIFQGVFRELFTPGIGGYVAILTVNKFLPKANLVWVAIIYCFPVIFVYVLISLFFIIFHAADYHLVWQEQLLGWGVAVATCIGTFLSVKNHAN